MAARYQAQRPILGALGTEPGLIPVVAAQHGQIQQGDDPPPSRDSCGNCSQRLQHPCPRSRLGISQADRRHPGTVSRAGGNAPFIHLLHDGSPTRGTDPDPSQAGHAVRRRRALSSLVSLPATDRRRVSHFQPFPPHQPHSPGAAPFPHVMTLMIRAVTLRRCTVTVPSQAWLYRRCLISVRAVH